MDAVFGDEAVDDVGDGVAVVGVEGVELVDAVGDGGVGWGEWVASQSEDCASVCRMANRPCSDPRSGNPVLGHSGSGG